MIFNIGDPVWNAALVEKLVYVSHEEASHALQLYTEDVKDDIAARKVMGALPARVRIQEKNLSSLAEFFVLQTFFHHQKHLQDRWGNRRVIWITMQDAHGEPEEYARRAHFLLWSEEEDMFKGAELKLENGVVITFDHQPGAEGSK